MLSRPRASGSAASASTALAISSARPRRWLTPSQTDPTTNAASTANVSARSPTIGIQGYLIDVRAPSSITIPAYATSARAHPPDRRQLRRRLTCRDDPRMLDERDQRVAQPGAGGHRRPAVLEPRRRAQVGGGVLWRAEPRGERALALLGRLEQRGLDVDHELVALVGRQVGERGAHRLEVLEDVGRRGLERGHAGTSRSMANSAESAQEKSVQSRRASSSSWRPCARDAEPARNGDGIRRRSRRRGTAAARP